MRSRNGLLWGILCLLLVCGATETAYAKSVFAISNHSTSNIRVYNIIGDKIDFQTQSSEMSSGAIDLAACFEEEVIFASFDGYNKFELINSKTLEYIKSISVSPEMAGLVYSQTYKLLFSAERYGSNIHAYSYDSDTQSLTEEAVIELNNVNGIYGICLDEEDMLFYLCESESYVKCYNLQVQNNEPDLVYAGKVDIKINEQSKIAVGATVYNDGLGTKYLYTTGYNHEAGQQHNYVIRTSLTDPNETNGRVGVELVERAVDADIDLDTGYLYLTVYDNSLRVYDSLSWRTDPDDCEYTDIDTEGYSGPAGVIVGSQYKSADKIGVSKVDDVNDDPNFATCILPDDEITYTIIIDPCGIDHEWVTVIDYLPRGVEFISADPCDNGSYDTQKHSYTWQLGGLSATDDPVVLEITVTVTEAIEPVEILVNTVSAESDHAYKKTTEETTVCCFGGDIIYVDCTVSDPNNGTSWELAYGNLQDALERIDETGCGDEVWVAAGAYSPGNSTTDTFEIPDGVVLYGGLAGNENPDYFDPNSRDAIQYKSILTGLNDSGKNDRVVTMGRSTKLHGFVVEKAYRQGFYSLSSDFTVERCVIQYNGDRGIECSYGNLTVNWCIIKNNTDDGIYHSGSNKKLKVNNCKICDNGENGIYSFYSTPTIKNSEINHNGWDNDYDNDNGIRIQSPSAAGTVCNCTVFRNEGHGVYFSGLSANKPDIRNCIFYNNNYHDDLTQFYGGLTAHYSSVTDPADPNSTDCTKYGDNNIKCDPKFAYININDHNLHLHPDSPCVDAGDPCDTCDGELDIDGDTRVLSGDDYTPDNGRVDMCADEVACNDIYNSLDWNIDAIVDIEELIVLANAWLSDPCAYNWDYRCDLDSDNFVNLVDFAAFGAEWLWQPCWASSGTGMWMMGCGSGIMSMESVSSEILTAPKPEPTIEEQIDQTEYLLDWLNDLWKTDEAVRDTIDKDQWKDFIDSIEAWLDELEEEL